MMEIAYQNESRDRQNDRAQFGRFAHSSTRIISDRKDPNKSDFDRAQNQKEQTGNRDDA
jgi:hypothetical protein